MKACGPIVLTALLLVSSAGTAAATAVQFIDPGPIGATFVLTDFDFPNATDLRFEFRFAGGKLVTYSGNSGVAGATGFYSGGSTSGTTWSFGFLTTSGDQFVQSNTIGTGVGGFGGMNAVHPNLTILGFYVERTSNNGTLLFVRIGPGGPSLTGMVTGVVSVESTTWSQVKGLYQD